MWIPFFLFLQLSCLAKGGKIEVAGGVFTAAGLAMVEGPTKSMLQSTATGLGELSAVKSGKETNKNIRSVMKYLEKMRLDVSASYTEQELASTRKSFAELIKKAKTLMKLFEDTIEYPEDALMQSRFIEQAKESKPYSMILAVKDIISSDYSNILAADMGSDIFHQLKTLRKTRDDVMALLNMLCVIEVYTISLQYPDTNSPPFKTNVNKVGELVDYIWKTMDDFIENFDSKEYFDKVERIIAAVMEENARKSNSAKADALMDRLQDIYTKDRFLVAVLDDEEKCDVRKIYDALPKNVAVSFIHNTIVYRSTNMSSYKRADFDKIATDLPIAVAPLSGLCSTNFAKEVRGNVTGAGFIVHDHKCGMEVRSDPRSKAHEETSFKCISKSIPNAIDNVKNMTKEKELANPFKRPMRVIAYPF